MLVEAIYENGMLRLLEPLPITQGQRVQVRVDVLEEAIGADELDQVLKTSGLWYEVDSLGDLADLPSQERNRLATLFSSDRPISDDVIEDRGIY